VKACNEIYELQKDALRRRYAVVNGETDEESKEADEDVTEEA